MRTVESVLAEVYESDWSLWDVTRSDRPWDYRPETVPSAFAAIMQIETEDVAQEAYNGLLRRASGQPGEHNQERPQEHVEAAVDQNGHRRP